MSRFPGYARVAVFVLGTLCPAVSQACPVCFSGSPRIRAAFFWTTILLTLVPLGMIGAGLAWLHRSGRLPFAEEFVESDELPQSVHVEGPDTGGEQPAPAQAAPRPA